MLIQTLSLVSDFSAKQSSGRKPPPHTHTHTQKERISLQQHMSGANQSHWRSSKTVIKTETNCLAKSTKVSWCTWEIISSPEPTLRKTESTSRCWATPTLKSSHVPLLWTCPAKSAMCKLVLLFGSWSTMLPLWPLTGCFLLLLLLHFIHMKMPLRFSILHPIWCIGTMGVGETQ